MGWAIVSNYSCPIDSENNMEILETYIMDDLIIPAFKKGDFSGGIRQGVDALDKMARLAAEWFTRHLEPHPRRGRG